MSENSPGNGPSVPDPDAGEGMLSQISSQMVRAMKQYYGKGPTQAKSYFLDDLLFIVMRGGTTRAEETMLEAGRQDSVRQFRQEFENEMAQRLTHMIEQITGRRVVNYQSQVMFDPDITIEMFVFDTDAGPREREETAAAVSARSSRVGLAGSEEVGQPDEASEE